MCPNCLLQGAKSILLYFVWRVGDDFHYIFQTLEIFFLFLFYFIEFLNVITAP